ncbi:Uncharacterised protein [Cedecea lapagei]|uniref:Uncharacterized protein n=1 Tax=Cedecea lapagei TaxID=158823 RepID=A0A3S4JA53_9ENTR|nr:Uncharacterised protein [Cedecea lapagei]
MKRKLLYKIILFTCAFIIIISLMVDISFRVIPNDVIYDMTTRTIMWDTLKPIQLLFIFIFVFSVLVSLCILKLFSLFKGK